MNQGRQKSATLRQILQRSVLSAGATVFLVAFVVALYLAYSNFRKEQSRHHHAIHQTLSELAIPAVSISDTIEANRLLGLISKEGEFFAIVTTEGDVLLSDYKWLASVMQSFPIKAKPVTCANLTNSRIQVFERKYEIYCSQLKGSPVYGSEGKSMGVLLGYFSNDMGPFIPQLFSVLIGIVIITLVILLYLLRRVLSNRILKPLENLVMVVKRKARHPLEGTFELDDIGRAPKEVQTLKAAYEEMVANFQNEHRERNEATRRAALYDLAKQIAHDIRSPLSALNMEIGSLGQLPESSRLLIRSAIGRIHDIATDLLRQKSDPPDTAVIEPEIVTEPPSVQLLSSIIDSIITEKRLQYRSKIEIEIHACLDAASYGRFANIQPRELKRALSNVIDNSVEAMSRAGQIRVSVRPDKEWVIVSIEDNGKGIPSEVLPKLTQKGQSFGKVAGTGLGLYHARTSVESWGGKLKISSEIGKGTIIELYLPRATSPDWFIPELILTPGSTVLVLDDDQTIHQSWQRRFDSMGVADKHIPILHLSTPEEILEFYRQGRNAEGVLYLIDYELIGYETTGLDIIENLGIAEQSILVTSRYEEVPIVERCCHLKVRMVPKGLAGFIPISIKNSTNLSPLPIPQELASIAAGVQR